MAVGDTFEDEREDIVDSQTGRTYTRLTRTSRNKHLYFYVDVFDEAGRIIYVSERDGHLNYYRMDLDTGVATQLTEETDIAAAGLACHNPSCGKLVYWAGKKLRILDTGTLTCDTVIDYPRYGGYLTLTADARNVLTYYDTGAEEDLPGGSRKWVGPWGIFGIPIDDPGSIETPSGNPVLETPCRVNHIQASPTDPDLIEYCWEGSWSDVPQRMWMTNLAGTEGGAMGRQRPNESRGHEFWFADGSKMGYHGTRVDADVNIGIIGTVTSDSREEWQLDLEASSGHCMYHQGRDLWITDRAGGDNAIAIIHTGDGIGRFERLCFHNSSWKSQGCHPHPQFSPGGSRLVWTTDGEGVSQVYMMEM